jgi:GAF domain-containing protein
MQEEQARREAARQAELDSYGIVDSLEERAYDDLTRMAADACQTPIALIAFLDHDRNWFKSRIGMSATQAPRQHALCEHLILQPGQVLVVPDATQDERFRTNPLVIGDPQIRFYAGVPLVSPAGHTLGAICAIDTQPRAVDAAQLDTLRYLARQVMGKLEERRQAHAQARSKPG